MDEQFVSRREFDQLRNDVTEVNHAVQELRSSNTAIAVLGTQLASLAQAVSEIKSGMADRFAKHDAVHEKEIQDRVSGRRWLIGMAIMGLAALIGLYGWIGIFLKK